MRTPLWQRLTRRARRLFLAAFGAFCRPDGPTLRELGVQALSSTERGYDLLAPRFEKSAFRTPQSLIKTVLRYVGPPRSVGSALDVCCGTGAPTRLLAPLCRDRVVGIDMSRGMLEVARESQTDPPLELIHCDALDMPFEGEFDVAVTFGSLGHILPADQPRFIARIARALKPGGRFIFVTAVMPPITSRSYWIARTFNAVMHVRNWLHRPPFIMLYLTFMLPEAVAMLRASGFQVEVHRIFRGKYRRLRLVVATRSL